MWYTAEFGSGSCELKRLKHERECGPAHDWSIFTWAWWACSWLIYIHMSVGLLVTDLYSRERGPAHDWSIFTWAWWACSWLIYIHMSVMGLLVTDLYSHERGPAHDWSIFTRAWACSWLIYIHVSVGLLVIALYSCEIYTHLLTLQNRLSCFSTIPFPTCWRDHADCLL